MSSLSNEQKQLLFDHCIGLASNEQSQKAEALISDDKGAAEIYQKLKAVFAPLSCFEIEECPYDLVERTMLRIGNLPAANKQLAELLEAEQKKRIPIKFGFLSNFSEIVAIAATILLIAGILIPTFGYAKQRYLQQRCQAFMGGDFYDGYQNYLKDHDNKQPAVAKQAGARWDTRSTYLLVTGGYVKPAKFICPGARNRKMDSAKYEAFMAEYRNYNDFPSRNYVTYSFAIQCPKAISNGLICRGVLMADRNPIFEELPKGNSEKVVVVLKKELLIVNSNNHNRRGQNVLFGDGRVEFNKTRFAVGHDDIYTLQDRDVYEGNETPSCTTDQFVAP
jgi:hypothetical protein